MPKCRECGVEVAPRCWKCGDCVAKGKAAPAKRQRRSEPIQVGGPSTVRIEQPRVGVVIDALRRVPPRSVDLYCGHKAVVGGTHWQGDDYACPECGPTWIARITR